MKKCEKSMKIMVMYSVGNVRIGKGHLPRSYCAMNVVKRWLSPLEANNFS